MILPAPCRSDFRANRFRLILLLLACLWFESRVGGEPWKAPEIRLPDTSKHPIVACTEEELGRLKAAWLGEGPAKAIVASVINRAEASLPRPITFPPKGGQHNRWYQCDKCETGLVTLDDTHHQCPLCKQTYSGSPYDDVIYSHKHSDLMRRMTDCAWAYAITGERKYAEQTKQILLGYAERYLKYPYHNAYFKWWNTWMGGHIKEQTLDEAVWLMDHVATSYDLIHDSGVLSAAEHEAIRSQLIRAMLKTIGKNPYGKVNWQSWHNAGFLWAGAVLGDVSWVERAILDKKNGFLFQLENSLTDDGFWYETSWGYHFYALQALVGLAEGARRLGIDLWSQPRFKNAFALPVSYTMPNGRLPRFGDDVDSTAVGHSTILEPAYHAYRDPALWVVMPQTPSWHSVMLGRDMQPPSQIPPLGSQVSASAGHAILRTRGEAGLAAAMTFGKEGGFHSHFDKLSFVFYGHKKELGVDPGRAANQAYRLPIHTKWYRATLSHNTVMVDKQSQQSASGELEFFKANDSCAIVAARCDTAHRGVRHRRVLLLTPTYLLVLDELRSEADRTFDWLYHNRGKGSEASIPLADGTLGEPFVGCEYINNRKEASSDEALRVRFVDDGLVTHLTLNAEPGTRLTMGDGPLASVTDRVPMVMVTRTGKQVRFAAVLEPVLTSKEGVVSGVSISTAGPGTLTVLIQEKEATGRLALGHDPKFRFLRNETVVLKSD